MQKYFMDIFAAFEFSFWMFCKEDKKQGKMFSFTCSKD